MKETFLDTPDDIKWLFDTHLKHLKSERFRWRSAILKGNEDAPDEVRLYVSREPLYTDRFWVVIKDGQPVAHGDIRPETPNPVAVRSLGHGRYRVSTPGGVKARHTTLAKALAQRRILRAAENPNPEEQAEASVTDAPPLYRVNYLLCLHSGKRLRRYPAFPVQILPSEDSTVELRFWSSAKYDVHWAFPGFQGEKGYVVEINYQIIYKNQAHHLVHTFEKAKVCLALDGLHADRVIMKAYKELKDFPKLPSDWQYFQFIN